MRTSNVLYREITLTHPKNNFLTKICRISCNYLYLTPTKRRNIWEITFWNTSDEKASYVLVEANEYLPRLRITDSSDNRLNIIPRHLLPPEIPKTDYTMLIPLKEEIEKGEFETIRIESMSTLPKDEKLSYDKRIFGFISDEFQLEIEVPLEEECSWYIGIFAPKGYHLKVFHQGDYKDIYQDESSYVFRSFSKEAPQLSTQIRIPSRITLWLLFGLFFSLVTPLLAFPVYFYAKSLTVSFSMILGTIAAVLAMRAWLFYSVELLDRANRLYLIAFIYSMVGAFILLLFCTHTFEAITQWLRSLLPDC